MDSNALAERLLSFAVAIIKISKKLPNTYSARHIYKQLIRSATSCGANYEETIAAESRADFCHKLQIVLKEMRESNYWLKLLRQSGLVKSKKIEPLIHESYELIKIVSKSVKTAKGKKI
ncbi:MAG TPA: four helix bundle protein [bacterium]|nr:four helix bundle protein [bacterium]